MGGIRCNKGSPNDRKSFKSELKYDKRGWAFISNRKKCLQVVFQYE